MHPNQSATAPQELGVDFVLIKGETLDGKRFRPSDWCDRLHSTLRALDAEEYEECVEYVHLVNSESGKGILIDRALQEVNPMLFKFFMSFVKNNNLAATSFTKEKWEIQKTAAEGK